MKKILSLVVMTAIVTGAFADESKFVNNNAKIDSIQNEITLLTEKVNQLKREIESKILENGYSIPVKKQYSFTTLKFSENEYGDNVIDTIQTNDVIKIIDKATSYFKVIYKGRVGYVKISDMDVTGYPVLNLLRSCYLREYTKSESNYSTGSSSGGSVSVKGYYRKDGTYVRPHTRSSRRR